MNDALEFIEQSSVSVRLWQETKGLFNLIILDNLVKGLDTKGQVQGNHGGSLGFWVANNRELLPGIGLQGKGE